jgi:signal transduction histidine kinase
VERCNRDELPVGLGISSRPYFPDYPRQRWESELQRSEAFFLEAQRLSCTGSFSWCLVNDEITWSEQLYRIFEFDRGVPLTLALIGSRVHPEDLASFREMIERARRDGADIENEYRLLMPDHSIKHLHTVAHGTRDKDGWSEYIGAVQDVTRRRLAEEALCRARLELAHAVRVMSLGALTASIAHEVNQPLTGIITNAGTCLRMLSAEPPDIEGARDTARRTLRDGNRASEVISRLRALFRKKEAKAELVDLNEVTGEVIALSLSELQRHHVTLRTDLADELPPVVGDRVQLQQVILNLLLNAVDAMARVEDGTRVLVVTTVHEEGDRVRLSVRDSGVGVESQVLARLFEPFYTTKSDGMGIGLFVSRSIIESHRGSLRVTANEGPGVTFSFSVPRARRSILAGIRVAPSPKVTQSRPRADSGRVIGAPG